MLHTQYPKAVGPILFSRSLFFYISNINDYGSYSHRSPDTVVISSKYHLLEKVQSGIHYSKSVRLNKNIVSFSKHCFCSAEEIACVCVINRVHAILLFLLIHYLPLDSYDNQWGCHRFLSTTFYPWCSQLRTLINNYCSFVLLNALWIKRPVSYKK